MKRLVVLVLALLLASCGGATTPDRTTDTSSSVFGTDAEKVDFLDNYLTPLSPIRAAEYRVIYHDNSGGIPGPSDYDITAVLLVAPADVAAWTDGMTPAPTGTDLSWGYALLPPDSRWAVGGTPDVYTRAGGVTLAVFPREGVLFKRVTSLP